MTQQYGTLKVDFITFTSGTTGNETDVTLTVSGLSALSDSGMTITGDITARNVTATGTLSGATITGDILNATSITGVTGVFTTLLSGASITGELISGTSGIYTYLSGASITGNLILGTSGVFTNVTGTTINSVTGSFTTGTFSNLGITGTITGNTVDFGIGAFATSTSTTGYFPDTSGTSAVGSVAFPFASGVFTNLIVNDSLTATLTTGLFGSGTESAPSISFDDDRDTGFYNAAANEVRITTSGNDRLTVDSTGNVGIGITSPTARLHIANDQGGAIGRILIDANVTSGYDTRIDATDDGLEFSAQSNIRGILFNTGGTPTERLRIDSSGRLLVGTSSAPTAGNAQFALLAIKGYAGGLNDTAYFALLRGEASTSITANEGIGEITFGDQVGNPFARIRCDADSNAGVSDYPGRLTFSTTADGGSSPTERLRITSTGNVGIGTTAPTEALEVAGNAILDATDATLKIKAGGVGTTGAVNFTFNTESTLYGGLDLDYDTRASVGLRLFSLYPITFQSANSTSPIIFKQGSTNETVRIASNGNVGIGTSSPGDKLVVNGPVGVQQNITAANPTLRFGTNGSTNAWLQYQNSATNGTGILDITTTNTYAEINTRSTRPLLLNNDAGGNVGIGTSSPGSKLGVNGIVTANNYKETVFTITWSSGFVLNPNKGGTQFVVLGGNSTPTQSNWSNGESITLHIDDGSSRTINWNTLSVVWTGGSAPTLANSGDTVVQLWKAGNVIYGALVGEVA